MARFIVRPSNPALWWSSISTPTPTARIITSQTVQTAQTATAVTRLRHVRCVSSRFFTFAPVFPYYSSRTLSHSILLLCEQSRALCASRFFSSLLSRPLLIFLPTRPRAPCPCVCLDIERIHGHREKQHAACYQAQHGSLRLHHHWWRERRIGDGGARDSCSFGSSLFTYALCPRLVLDRDVLPCMAKRSL